MISVVISAYNEEKRIGACLSSVSWADEIVVVDNSSTDETAAIAKKHGAKVYSRPNYAMLNINKNYGFSKATGEWILNLDADERVTQGLEKEIAKIVKSYKLQGTGMTPVAYRIPRKNIIFGKWIRHTGWWPDYQLRLFRKGAGRFPENHVHEQIPIKGEIGETSHPIEHENYQTISQFIAKMNLYTDNEADQIEKKGYTFSALDGIRYPKEEFFRRYFAGHGYKDGFHGLMLSMAMALYHFVIFLKLWERNGFVTPDISAHVLIAEIEKSYREGFLWLSQVGKTRLGIVRRIRIKLGLP